MAADRIRVLPNVPSAIGMKHPFDCPLDEAGSEWPYDSFTCRRLADESIRRAEVEPNETATEAAHPDDKAINPVEAEGKESEVAASATPST